jgi:hypothetical protein
MAVGFDWMDNPILDRKLVAVPSILGATLRTWVKWVATAVFLVVVGTLFVTDTRLSNKWPFSDINPSNESQVVPIQSGQMTKRTLAAEPALILVPAQAIFSDTAMSPVDYRNETSCQDHIRTIVQKVSESYPLIFKPNPDGIYYARYQDKQDNYVLRCFRINKSSYRLFMSGSGTEKLDVSKGLRRFYEAASKAV